MCQPVLVFDSLHPTAFVDRSRELGFRLADIRDPEAKVRDQVFTVAVIWDSPVTYRALDRVPRGQQRFRALERSGELRLHTPSKGTLRNMTDPVGFLAYCFGVEKSWVRFHWPSGGFTIRQRRQEESVRPPADVAATISTAAFREAIAVAPVSPDYATAFLARLEAEGILGSETIDVYRLAEAVDRIGDDASLPRGFDFGIVFGVTAALTPPVSIPGVSGQASHG